jgi:hypothetical protein
MTELPTRPRRLVQLDLPAETVKAIDRLAGAETISRAAWTRRLRAVLESPHEAV